MFRAVLTLTVAVVTTLVLSPALLTVSIILPSRWCLDPLFYVWARLITAVAGVRLTVVGRDRLDLRHPYFFVGNHQSAMDIPILGLAMRGHVRFMAKKSLFQIPLFGWIIRANGFVPIDRSSPRRAKMTVDAMLRRLSRRPVSMVVFPEGTRREDGQLGSFKRGSLQVCRRAGMIVVPFAIDGSYQIHRRGRFHIQSGDVSLSVGSPIAYERVREMSVDGLVDCVREEVSRLLGSPADVGCSSGEPVQRSDGGK